MIHCESTFVYEVKVQFHMSQSFYSNCVEHTMLFSVDYPNTSVVNQKNISSKCISKDFTVLSYVSAEHIE